jgi:hypothetical protein
VSRPLPRRQGTFGGRLFGSLLVFAFFFWSRSWYGTNTLSYRRTLGMDLLGLESDIGRHTMHKRDIIHTKNLGGNRSRHPTRNRKIGSATIYFPIILNNVFLLPTSQLIAYAFVLQTNSLQNALTRSSPYRLTTQFDPALIAQLVERVTSNDEVAGSTPS